MNAYPLKNGRGDVVAWACGVCDHPAAGWTSSGGWGARDAEMSRDQAARCCRCNECGRQRAADSWSHCDNAGCIAARKAAEEARRAKWAAQEQTDCDSFELAVEHHDYAWRFELLGGRQGIVYVGGAWSGMFHSAYARLDPTDYDPEPRVFSETLQRSEQGCPWAALAALCLAQMGYGSEVPITHFVLCPDGEARGKDPALLRVDALELVTRSEGVMRAEVAAMLRGEDPGDPPRYLSDEARAARALIADRDDLRELVKGLDKANADLRAQVLELQRRTPAAASGTGPST